MTYHQFTNDLGEPYGSFEVFYAVKTVTDQGDIGAGWYWWPCFPGCTPDDYANGPFKTEKDAISDALQS